MAFHNFTAMCSIGFEKKDASIRLWKGLPGRLIGTCHLTWTVALLARACANLVPIPRALKNYMEPTALNNVCACATHHVARRLGITTNPMKMAAYSKFC